MSCQIRQIASFIKQSETSQSVCSCCEPLGLHQCGDILDRLTDVLQQDSASCFSCLEYTLLSSKFMPHCFVQH